MKLKDLAKITQGSDKKSSVLQQASVTLHKITQKISLGDIHFQKGGYEIPNNMSHFLAELSLKNLPESHEFCAFGIHFEY